MATQLRPSVDTVLLASSVPYTPTAYVIGPFATRVNFSSQQRRALNLIWSINDDFQKSGDKDGLAGKDVAIVGAGLAGLTAAVGVAAFGGSAWNLERQEDIFERMLEANHRDIHPTINFWPQEEINPSTYLPFFNWHHASCDLVLQRIKNEWEDFERLQPGIKGVTPHCTVQGFDLVQGKWRIRADTHEDHPLPDMAFDVLILATGFGEESLTGGSPGYWQQPEDRIREIRRNHADPCEDYVVSGTGDGGIIEVLRLLYSGFRAGGIEAIMNAVLKDSVIPKKVKFFERAAQRKLTDMLLHDAFPISEQNLDDLSDFFWSNYFEIANGPRLGESFQKAMSKIRTKVPKVTLLGLRKTPLSINQSPYHKLLIAYAFKQGLIEYYQIDKDTLDVIDCTDIDERSEEAGRLGIRPKTVKFASLRRSWMDGASPRNRKFERNKVLEHCFFLSRHGYESPIDQFYPRATGSQMANFIRHRQALYADQDFLTQHQIDYFASSLNYPIPSNKDDWLDKHLDEMKRFFADQFGIDLKPVSAPMVVEDGQRNSAGPGRAVAVQLAKGEVFEQDTDEKFKNRGWLIPTMFYGVRVLGLNETTADITDRGGFST